MVYSTSILYEATLQAQNIQVRADLLAKEKDFISVIEVKSSTSIKDLYVIDCAIQYWVMDEAGFTPGKISLAHINNQFVYQGEGDYNGLFKVLISRMIFLSTLIRFLVG